MRRNHLALSLGLGLLCATGSAAAEGVGEREASAEARGSSGGQLDGAGGTGTSEQRGVNAAPGERGGAGATDGGDRAPGEARRATLAVRAGWADGVGAEFELRPGHWGVGSSGGYVPGYGPGGYFGLQWGWSPLGVSGLVAEAGVFHGVPSPLREAAAGFGLYGLVGYDLVAWERPSARGVLGGGVPFAQITAAPTFEFLAKLTLGWVF